MQVATLSIALRSSPGATLNFIVKGALASSWCTLLIINNCVHYWKAEYSYRLKTNREIKTPIQNIKSIILTVKQQKNTDKRRLIGK